MTAQRDLRVEVDAAPEPGLLRPAIEAALAGRPWPAGPEATVARVVAEATQAATAATTPGTRPATGDEPTQDPPW